jgi:hypothetical protein
MGIFLNRFLDPDNSIKIQDLTDNHREKKDRVTKKVSKKKRRNSEEELIKDLVGFYNPVRFFLETTPGNSVIRSIGLDIASDIINAVRDFWKKM